MAHRKNISAALAIALFNFTGLLSASPMPIVGPGAMAADSETDIPQSCFVLFKEHSCSATIISRTQALTAAHCGSPANSTRPKLFCGKDQEKHTGTLTVTSGYDFSGDWSLAIMAKDYAIITLDAGQELSAAPLPFAKSSQWEGFSDYDNNHCLIAGWGRDNNNDYGKLYLARVSEIAFDGTNSAVITIGWTGKDVNSAANGDSGGTLMCRDGGAWYLAGVLAAGGNGVNAAAVSTIDWQ